MDKPIHMCRYCRHFREPVRPSAFMPGAVRSGRQFDSATRELTESERERELEEQRFADDVSFNSSSFDSPPGFFPWCARFTLSGEEIDELNRRLRLGDHRLARNVIHQKLAKLNGAQGVLIPLYALCDRVNKEHDCTAFESSSLEMP